MAPKTVIDLVQLFHPCHCHLLISNKCDEITAYLYLAKHLSLIILFIYQQYPKLLHYHKDPSSSEEDEQYI